MLRLRIRPAGFDAANVFRTTIRNLSSSALWHLFPDFIDIAIELKWMSQFDTQGPGL